MTTDPDQSPGLVQLRPSRPSAAFPHAQATKIVTAGLSLSAVFGIVAYLGASAASEQAAADRDLRRLALSEAIAAVISRPPVTVPESAPPMPATTLPAGAPTPSATPAVVPVPVAVPAATPAPRPASGGGRTSTPAPAATTKTSG